MPTRRSLGALLLGAAATVTPSAHAAPAHPQPAAPPAPPSDVTAHATPAIRVFTDKDGLPQNTVNAEVYGTDGRLWVGTQEGLATYDGQVLKSVAFPEGTRSQWVDALAALPDGSIAAGTHSDGVWILSGDHFEHLTTASGLAADAIHALAAVGQGELWIATAKGLAIRKRDGSLAPPAPADAPLGDAETTVLALGAGDRPALAMATAKGLALRERDSGAWRTFLYGQSGLADDAVAALAIGPGARADLWVGFANAGVYRLDGAAWRKVDGIPSPEIGAIAPATPSGSTWWIGTGAGLVHLDGDRTSVLDASNSPFRDIRSLLPSPSEDGPPAVWVGTSSSGLARVTTGGWRALTPKNSPLQSAVYAYGWSHAPNGSLETWIGTETGLSMYDAAGWHDVPVPGVDPYVNAILDAHGDASRGLWVATFGGVARRRADGTWSSFAEPSGLPSRIVLSLAEAADPTGQPELLAGLRRGFARFKGDRWESITDPGAPSKEEVTSITESSGPAGRHLLWVATTDGLFRRDGATWTRLQPGTSPLPGSEVLQVQAIHLPGDRERLFVSTGENGLAWFDPTTDSPRWFTLTTKSTPPLPDDVVYGVQQDRQGRVYAFTNHGVARLSPRDAPDTFDVDVFTTEDGLPSNECNTGASAIDPSGRVWAGTVAGAGVLDPAATPQDRAPKRLLLSAAHVFDRPIDLAKRSSLAYDEDTLAFDFSLLSFHRETDTRYRTQLVGFERAPSPWTPDAKVRYTRLPAGTYELHVWGRDYAGNVSAPLVVPFAIRTAPWLAWWAWLAYTVSTVSLVALGVRARTANLRRRARELSERVAERTAELATRNAELAASIHELDRKNAELDRKNAELVESQQRADRIFSAFADVLPGSVLDGKYRIGEKIGAGGFGAVFRANQVALDRAVAVKIFRPEQGNDSAAALERFQREAMTACRVNHPNAIQMFDTGISTEGIPYIVMELLEGRSLADEMDAEKGMSARRAIDIAVPVCEALAAAHAAGLIHRDIKPDNVFLQRTKDGEIVKLLDFGIAKLLEGDEGNPGEDSKARTGSAALIGTPRYMAPERLTRGTYDDRSDVYSVGVMLYEMILARLPWRQATDDLMVLITNIVSGSVVPMQQLGVPSPLAALVMRTLSGTAEDRPRAGELAEQLVAFRTSLPAAELDAVYGVRKGYVDPGAETAKIASRRPPAVSGEAPTIAGIAAKAPVAKRG